MKKTKTNSAARARVKTAPASRKPVDLVAMRKNIANLVGGRAVSMVETTIAEVDKGHYAAMKYLFELVGLFPGNTEEATGAGESVLAKTLLRRLAIPEETKTVEKVTKGIAIDNGEPGESKTDTVE